jgi:hypothetical protein
MRRIHHSVALLAYIAILNGLLYLVIGLLMGGFATFGKVIEGHYFLGHKGVYTEVNVLVFHYSRLHEISILGLFLITGAAWPAQRVIARVSKSETTFSRSILIRRAFDALTAPFWLVGDAWRKPTADFFARMAPTFVCGTACHRSASSS